MQVEEWDQCCLSDIHRHDDGGSLAGYDFGGDGFPPPGQPAHLYSPEEHAASARPAPAPTPAAPAAVSSAGSEGGGKPAADGAAMGASPLGSPACGSLDAASLTKLAYRYRRIAKLCSFGLQALGTAAERSEWEVRRGAVPGQSLTCPPAHIPAAQHFAALLPGTSGMPAPLHTRIPDQLPSRMHLPTRRAWPPIHPPCRHCMARPMR